MGIFGIASGILGEIGSAVTFNSNKQQIKQGFQLLGQDLQSGNLSQVQSDFAALQQLLPGGQQNSLLTPASGTQGSNPLATAVSQLAQDLKSGNLNLYTLRPVGTGPPVRQPCRRPTGLLLSPAGPPAIRAQRFLHIHWRAFRRLSSKLQRLRLADSLRATSLFFSARVAATLGWSILSFCSGRS